MSQRRFSVVAAILAAALLPCGAFGDDEPPTDAVAVEGGTYLRPNIALGDGRPAYAHVTEADMPWRIAIGRPKRPPKFGSTRQAREIAIEAIRGWETAIQKRVPWFALEFVEKDPTAPVQVVWKRRITGPWAGFGRMAASIEDGRWSIGGEMQVSTTPSRFHTITLEEVGLLIAHEFGHVLGLGHCLECDSAMNYSWHTRDRTFVTEVDVETFARLVAIPNGTPAE